jgi:hypothetical protein
VCSCDSHQLIQALERKDDREMILSSHQNIVKIVHVMMRQNIKPAKDDCQI